MASYYQTQNLTEEQVGQGIKDVWIENLEDELAIISELVQKYNYISVVSNLEFLIQQDTEFPGVIIEDVPLIHRNSEVNY